MHARRICSLTASVAGLALLTLLPLAGCGEAGTCAGDECAAGAPGGVAPGGKADEAGGAAAGASLQERATQAHANNVRARKYINRLLEGYEPARILEAIATEQRFLAESLRILERTHYERSAQRRAYHDEVLLTQAQLSEAEALVSELAATDGWQGWFAEVPVCHRLEVVDFTLVERVRALVETSFVFERWEILPVVERQAAVRDLLAQAAVELPEHAAALQAAAEDPVVVALTAAPTDLVTVRSRLELVLQVTLSGRLTRLSCAGDDRVQETTTYYERGIYYNYGYVPSKDVWILRHVTGYAGTQTERFNSSDYLFSFQGLDERGRPLAGPRDQSERILNVREDGVVERGPLFDRYFTAYGLALPEAVAPEDVPTLVHAVDAYLASYLRHEELALELHVTLGVSSKLTVEVAAQAGR